MGASKTSLRHEGDVGVTRSEELMNGRFMGEPHGIQMMNRVEDLPVDSAGQSRSSRQLSVATHPRLIPGTERIGKPLFKEHQVCSIRLTCSLHAGVSNRLCCAAPRAGPAQEDAKIHSGQSDTDDALQTQKYATRVWMHVGPDDSQREGSGSRWSQHLTLFKHRRGG